MQKASRIVAVFMLLTVTCVLWAQGRSLDEVESWLYYIDVNIDETTFEAMVGSDYDMVVIDFITSETANQDYPLAELIDALHNADHPKLVIAYIDVGQAESYRTYWQPGWGIGEPEWIVSEDPDGWAENYPVAYWYDEWREIWLADDGYLAQINEAGFDGVYLDWVEAYDDASVMAFAEAEDVDPVQEMIWWVEDIASTLHRYNAEAVVIAQNAAELAIYDDYVAVIDAIAQEQIWFDGGADNDPPGDCPLPRTEADIDTPAYIASLSVECLVQYETYPESTLHVSSEWYLDDLTVAQGRGLTIFTVDYAVNPGNIDWVYETSWGYGFVPFVSNRQLNQYLPPR